MHELERQAQNYKYHTKKQDALAALAGLDPEEVYALDFETTALFPYEGEIRLTTICGHGELFIIDHFQAGAFSEYADIIAKFKWAVFNAGFEGRWIDYHADPEQVVLYDVGHMRRAKLGGQPLSLATMCKRDLQLELDKTEQAGLWGQPKLTKQQLHYAALDGVVTFALWEQWLGTLTVEQWNGFITINEAWRGTYEMEDTGLQLDVEYHDDLLQWWTLKRDTAERYLRRWTPPSIIANLRSKKQISDFLKAEVLDDATLRSWPVTGKRGDLDLQRNTLTMAAHRIPYPVNRWLAALIIFNKMDKYISTYGQKLIDAQINLKRIPSRFNMAQAVTGRYSSSSFNLQNIPRNPVVRRSFVTPTVTRVRNPSEGEIKLVIADYKSIEVRTLAELAHDDVLLYDAIYGDPHSRSASSIFGIDFDYFYEVINADDATERFSNVYPTFKDMRSRAKAFTFQLLYGAGAAALAVPLRCTDDEAVMAIEAWAKTYPRAYHYRQQMFEIMQATGYLPVVDGRTIFVPKPDRTMPVAANYPVQGAAASVMYRAVYHVHHDLWEAAIPARMAASVHDELLLFAKEHCAAQARDILVAGMVKGWSDIFPGTNTDRLVDPVISWHWGAKK